MTRHEQSPTNPGRPVLTEKVRSAGEQQLLRSLKDRLAELRALAEEFRDEDRLYRVWRGSAKAFALLQGPTETTVELFCAIDPTGVLVTALGDERAERAPAVLNGPVEEFARIVVAGTHKQWTRQDNSRWLEATSPLVLAFAHCKYLVEAAIASAEMLEEPPDSLPSGWASVLCVFGLR
ncbi:MAG: hypothetical protein M0004_01710 [Actinomycetota bacterium]|nr:hypothetical protein [Actinomycetota bacterium]